MTGPAEGRTISLLVPGDIEQLSGGYGYARSLMTAWEDAGIACRHIRLPGDYPKPSAASLEESGRILEALPGDGPVLIDGLAFGAMPPELIERSPVRPVVLLHHPLGLETGLSQAVAAELVASEKAALAHCRGVVVTSTETARTVRELFGVDESDILVALPGLTPRPEASRTGKPKRILTVASLIPRKGYLDLVAALSRVRAKDWRADFIGSETADPVHAEAIRTAIRENGLEERIVIRGAVGGTALDGYFADASLFALASHYEGYGMAFAEAMSAGLPIVGCRGGAVPEVVTPEVGILVEPGDIDGLAGALESLLADNGRADAFAQGAKAASRSFPRWSETAASIAAFLQAEAVS